ncbi:TIGR00299 family protein [Pseudobutyrivibrio sp. YE44]|uniref:LarC family nickel insertion protein n=1 Tax=Pseudobutyrivibrio sp. YE44 TaxID=1520802 RepID=UPI00089179D5|nr:LarC family nickel insertion protein [Pseudobutyrivibrio sp. YE44]SDB05358.1 TIGR00299 family protein [Pseudobutyrivibrio sp. YE44]
MKALYFECSSGISGDMTVGALLDLGADVQVLNKALSSIKAEGFQTRISKVEKSGLRCVDFDVILDEDHDGHDHDMEYLYGHTHNHESHDNHNHNHDEHSHTHEAQPHDEHHKHHHEKHHHRGLKEINDIISSVDMTDGARNICNNIFQVLAEAESKAHGVPVDQVHFHEVGAIDSIVDIVSISVCLDNIGIDKVFVPKLTDGQGTVRCQHGILPVPVPAVLNIVNAADIPIEITETKGELVTPTGAATVAAVRTSEQLPESFNVEGVGMGAGKRDYGLSGILRIMKINYY